MADGAGLSAAWHVLTTQLLKSDELADEVMHTEGTTLEEVSKVLRTWNAEQTRDYIAALPFWGCEVQVRQHFGGLQNRTYFATTPDGNRYAVRTGFDQFRTRQTSVVQCTMAAHRLGLGPRLAYAEPNLTIVEFVEGKGMTLEQMKDPDIRRRVVDRMKVLHEGSWAVQETISYWWPFDSVRRYLNWMQTGRAATGSIPSRWAHRVPELRDITNRLERVIAPYIPKFTHNDMVFVNMILTPRGEILFIDWDGGGYGHPMWDLGEMLMWAEADDEVTHKAVLQYHGSLAPVELKQKLREVRAFQVMAAMRLITESMDANLDPYYYLTPEEQGESMKVILPGQSASLDGLIELLIPRFESLWALHKGEFGG
jgi:thiamine kinase-like enzyme